MKICKKCNVPKDDELFPPAIITKFNKSGRKSACCECAKKQKAEWYNKNHKSQKLKPVILSIDKYGNETLKCIRCDKDKQLRFFYKSPITRANKSGKNKKCIECCLEQGAKWRNINFPKKIKVPKISSTILLKDRPLTHEPIIGEKWKSVIGYGGKYLISNMGRIFSIKNNSLMSYFLNNRGYCKIRFSNPYKEYSIHRLVALHFISNPDNKPEINHIKGIKTDNRYHQLEWCTTQENTEHAWRIGLCKAKPSQRKTIQVFAKSKTKAVAIYDINNKHIKSFVSMLECATFLNRHISSVSDAVKLNSLCNNHYIKIDADFIYPKKIITKILPIILSK